ncbi:hypothetical protein [Actinoplanes sp. NPDC051411]|uniref:hypothetical protein n=1 Tax=Actinoplanes sp. NPDC051411 TaxID=3155522 RepID=UPI003444ED5C
MIPRAEIELDPALPRDAPFWMPAEDEIGDEGIGFFRGVWAIYDEPLSEAARVVADERAAAAAVNAVSTDVATFEYFARVIEAHNPDFPSEDPDDERTWLRLPNMATSPRSACAALNLGSPG